ncbi:hypothetical protein R0I52_00280 [Psychrobacter sp. CAM01]|uniref:hypothetical protein n=1 Tax=Psychrobacter sp. CAM01 TaxID=3080335 RepID=UPI0029355E8F|nr:hypothetical protein [Psychrobacter sp. CAM01]MDV2859148.1 hypothetical protein [Psychrobacter sp. CAM01]
MTTQSNKSLRDYTMKADISQHHERIIRNLFNALFVEQQEGHVIDHTPNISDIMTLDLNQIQWLLIKRREGDYSQDDILDALKGLEFPKLLFNGTISTYSDFNGKQINAIRLDYSQPAKTDELAEELAQIDLGEALADEIDKCDAGRRWMEQQDTIQSLRSVIVDMAETLHVADPNARISMTSSDLLDLINSQNDMSDNAF